MTRVEKLLNDTKEALTKAVDALGEKLETKVTKLATRVDEEIGLVYERLNETKADVTAFRASLEGLASKVSLVENFEGRLADLEKKAEQRTEAA